MRGSPEQGPETVRCLGNRKVTESIMYRWFLHISGNRNILGNRKVGPGLPHAEYPSFHNSFEGFRAPHHWLLETVRSHGKGL